MADTGVLPVTSYTDIDNLWTNEGYITTDDTNFATVSLKKNQSYELACFFSGLSLPAGCTVNGVQVSVISKVANTVLSLYANLINNTPAAIGTAKSVTFAAANTEYTKTFGSSSDTWGVASWANFAGCWLYFSSRSNTSYIGSVDYVTMQVWYTEATTAINKILGVAKASVKLVNGLAIASVNKINGLS